MIKVNLKGLSKVKDKLKQYQLDTKNSVKKELETLSDESAHYIGTLYSTAYYDGENDVEVLDPTWIEDNKLELKAKGASILFIEFGSGIHFNKTSHGAEYGLMIGEYGQGKGNKEHWAYYGHKGDKTEAIEFKNKKGQYITITKGNPPNDCFIKGHQHLKDGIKKRFK